MLKGYKSCCYKITEPKSIIFLIQANIKFAIINVNKTH